MSTPNSFPDLYMDLSRGVLSQNGSRSFGMERLLFQARCGSGNENKSFPKTCVYCNSTTDLTTDHLIPRSRGGDDSSDNVVLACQPCNTSRGEKGVFEWLGLKEKDKLHRLVAGKYLKQLLALHERGNTLEVTKDRITILCKRCGLPKVCERWEQ